MGRKGIFKKRPCRICRRWFMPNPKVKDNQKTCGDPWCKREWHRKKCAEWNRKNAEYFKANYLQKKLEAVTRPEGTSKTFQLETRLKLGLPISSFQEVISIQQAIIIEYFGQLLFRRFQEALRLQLCVIKEEIVRLPP